MRVAVVIDSHFFKTPDGHYWCQGITDNSFFERYTSVFESVNIVARVKGIDNAEKNMVMLNDNINIVEMPFARGIKEYVKNYHKFRKIAKSLVEMVDCAIFRLPSILSYIVADVYKNSKKPYSIEVVACPKQAYAHNKLASKYFSNKLEYFAKNANGASYVTEHYLQNMYPNHEMLNGKDSTHFTSYYSSIDLTKDFFAEPKFYNKDKSSYTICHTANISASLVKGQDIVIKIVGILNAKGYDVSVRFIGDSEIRDQLMSIAEEQNIADKVKFTGLLPSKKLIRDNLMDCDIFVLPTQAEGLPRSIIEAMAVGLPCVSTPVNGVPELLSDRYLVEQQDFEAFAGLILELINNPSELNEMSANNIEKAHEYEYDILSLRREEYYKKLKNLAKGL